MYQLGNLGCKQQETSLTWLKKNGHIYWRPYQRSFGSGYCRMQSCGCRSDPAGVSDLLCVGLGGQNDSSCNNGCRVPGQASSSTPAAKGTLSLMVASMGEGGSFLAQYLDSGCFIHMPTPESITGGRGKKYLHSKAMGTHP